MTTGVIAADDPRSADVRRLLERHLAFANEHSPPEDVHALDIDGLLAPSISFFSYRAEGELETRDRMQFTIAAKVADVLPNGQLLIEAQQTITNNEEVWKQTLRGYVRPEDVLPNNKVLSENIAELTICKDEMGSVRDSYRRGWVTRLYDYFSPF